ncbi:MAG: hypothetical protein M1445_03090 [Bacteroidetes bacterium]|nr:hypothetical protein [Bacteroidota bacterium]MCL6103712.1 hypothetical protein [Bacteroidota bacterium]
MERSGTRGKLRGIYKVMKKLLILVFVLLFSGILKAQEQQIPYNQNDRDRMVRVETKVKSHNLKSTGWRINLTAISCGASDWC